MPSDFVNRLCRMLQDIEMNKDFNVELKSNLQSLSNKDQLIGRIMRLLFSLLLILF